MGVYIKGMEIPKIDLEWRIIRGKDGKWYAIDVNAETSDGEWHEIVPVPPHGRLIDGDALCKTLRSLAENEYMPEVFANWIENHIDTIIPASEEGEA